MKNIKTIEIVTEKETITTGAEQYVEVADNKISLSYDKAPVCLVKVTWENTYFDLDALNDFEIWYADYEEVPQTSCHFTWWQYSETGYVPGIKGAMDLNLWIRNRD